MITRIFIYPLYNSQYFVILSITYSAQNKLILNTRADKTKTHCISNDVYIFPERVRYHKCFTPITNTIQTKTCLICTSLWQMYISDSLIKINNHLNNFLHTNAISQLTHFFHQFIQGKRPQNANFFIFAMITFAILG